MGRPGRRKWTTEQKERIVEGARAPGASVSVVARRYDLNANLLFKWKRLAEAGQLGGPLATIESAELVPIGVVGQAGDGRPALLARMPGMEPPTAGNAPARPDELRRSSGCEGRAGVIEIDLPEGALVRVDAFVDGRALARVLSALKRHA
jgi:transposase